MGYTSIKWCRNSQPSTVTQAKSLVVNPLTICGCGAHHWLSHPMALSQSGQLPMTKSTWLMIQCHFLPKSGGFSGEKSQIFAVDGWHLQVSGPGAGRHQQLARLQWQGFSPREAWDHAAVVGDGHFRFNLAGEPGIMGMQWRLGSNTQWTKGLLWKLAHL